MHSQGVVHRDIKPENLLLTDDDVLKIVDFGVSEMFEKSDDMRTAKSAGSPAFLPPELCVAKHGDVSGKAADIWSMGVSLYCLRYGRIPFEREGVLEMYEAIKTEVPKLPPDENPDFVDLMRALLEKDPEKRITMAELRVSGLRSSHTGQPAQPLPGTPVGDEKGYRPLAQHRRELLQSSRSAQLARAEPRLHPEDEPSDLRRKSLFRATKPQSPPTNAGPSDESNS